MLLEDLVADFIPEDVLSDVNMPFLPQAQQYTKAILRKLLEAAWGLHRTSRLGLRLDDKIHWWYEWRKTLLLDFLLLNNRDRSHLRGCVHPNVTCFGGFYLDPGALIYGNLLLVSLYAGFLAFR